MIVWLSVVAIAVMATLYLVGKRLSRPVPPRDDLHWLPAVLHDAELVWSEKSFRSEGPMPIAVRIDRAYRSPREGLVLIEFKHREKRRAYLSDVVELSAQRYVLQLAGHVVSRRGFVVVILPGGTRSQALAVDLQDERQVLRRVSRLVELMERRASPRGATQPACCDSCGHRDACPWTGFSPQSRQVLPLRSATAGGGHAAGERMTRVNTMVVSRVVTAVEQRSPACSRSLTGSHRAAVIERPSVP